MYKAGIAKTVGQTTTYIRFQGLNAPVLLDGCAELVAQIERIMPGWPFEAMSEPGEEDPAVAIAPVGGGEYESVSLSVCGEIRRYDSVETICDMIVELSLELLRSSPTLMCLHGAAIELAGRLVIIPNIRRAGKSTLTACLAHRGARVFSDDFFTVGLSQTGGFQGAAMGISPRLRLPVPESLSAGFRDWVAGNAGPGNHRYKYLALPHQPPHGTACPLGAIVILDRRDAAPPDLRPMDPHEAAAAMMHQNFARSVHSGTILHMVTALLAAVQPFRLTYASAEDAAALLEDRFATWPDAPPRVAEAGPVAFRQVDEALLNATPPAFHEDVSYRRKEGFSEVEMNGGLYLTDTHGLGVHRLNNGSLAIWRLLEEPMRLDEVCDVLAEVFPDIPRARIEGDSARTMRSFVEHRLAEPV